MYSSHNLWDNFLHSISTPQAARWYVNAFLASFNQADLSEGEQHALRVCCLLAIPPPPPGARDVTLNVTPDLSQVSLNSIVRLVEDLASGMGQLGSHIEANCAVISRTLVAHLARVMGQPACITCLRPRQSCDCWALASYKQLRTSPPTFTTLTLTAPHQVTSQAGGLHSMAMPSFGLMEGEWQREQFYGRWRCRSGRGSSTLNWNTPSRAQFYPSRKGEKLKQDELYIVCTALPTYMRAVCLNRLSTRQ